MKKFISTAMAVSMALSMGTVAFASEQTAIKVDENSKLYKEKDGILYEVTGEISLAPGNTIYVEILPQVEGEIISNRTASQHKVVLDLNQGKDVVESSTIQNKKVKVPTGTLTLKNGETAPYSLGTTYSSTEELQMALNAVIVHSDICKVLDCVDPNHLENLTQEEKDSAFAKYTSQSTTAYKYMAAIETKSSFTTKQMDLIGNVKVVKKSTGNSSDAPSKTLALIVGHGIEEISGDMHEVLNTEPVIDFDDVDSEVELLFGSTASFTVDAHGQSKLFLGYTEKPNGDIIDQNLEANIDFITFKANPNFNRMGMMRLFGEEDMYIYEIQENGALKEIDTKYDEDYSAYAFKTRALTSYAISDMPLSCHITEETPTEKPSEPTTPTTPSKPNPPTGRGM